MATLTELYVRAFSAESFFGLEMIINWLAVIVIVWIVGLTYLVWKSDSTQKGRFMATLLFFEGLKCLWQGTNIVPYSVDLQNVWDIGWILKIDVFFIAQITAIILYFLFPVYFKINSLKFMYRKNLQKYSWFIAPILGIIIWFSIKDTTPFRLQNASWLSCSAVGAQPELHLWYGQITSEALSIQNSIGACPGVFETLISDQQVALWALTLIGTPVSIVALVLIRISQKKYAESSEDFMTSQTLYTGFLGKVIGNVVFFSTILLIIPLINGEPAGFISRIEWRYVDRSFMANVKYFIFTVNLGFPVIAIGFEAMMFVYASTKGTVLGIDKKLRKTFTNTIFTGVGAIAFIASSEIMENLLGFGLVGGVMLGVGLFAVRRPVIGILDGISNRLIPSEYTSEELEYLELFSTSSKDGEITDNERILLKTLATAYGITDERVVEIEDNFLKNEIENSNQDSTPPEMTPVVLTIEESEILVVQQWIDEKGYTWRRMSDGSTQWWNGTVWEIWGQTSEQ